MQSTLRTQIRSGLRIRGIRYTLRIVQQNVNYRKTLDVVKNAAK